MAQASFVIRDWDFDVERGPDWLFVRPHRADKRSAQASQFGQRVWELLEQSLTHRLVLVMDGIGQLDSDLVAQLVWLYERIHAYDGVMRVCELSARNEKVLRACGADNQFPRFDCREDAVMGHSHPRHPR